MAEFCISNVTIITEDLLGILELVAEYPNVKSLKL
jgi:hypothetical protein